MKMHHPIYGHAQFFRQSDINLSELDPSNPHSPYRIHLRIGVSTTRTWTL